MPQRALVDGGAGFLGSHICKRLLDQGHEVICMDNLRTGSHTNIDPLLKHPRFRFLEYDITKPIVVEGPLDQVWHFASPASPVDYSKYPIQTLKVGALGTHHALGLCKEKEASFLLASTSEVYGDPQISPQPETYWGNVNPIGPRGVYDEAKRFAEAMTMAYQKVHGIRTHIARIFNTYGPHMRPNDGRAIPSFIVQALGHQDMTVHGTGLQTRSFCYVDDLLDGLERLMESDVAEPVNLGNPDEHTVLEIAHLIIRLAKSRSRIVHHPLPQDDPKTRCPDITRAKSLLKWEPRVDLITGLQKTIAWFHEVI